MRPPSQAPVKLPVWCERNTRPARVERNLRPWVWPTSPMVSGTVESQRTPMTAEKTSTLASLAGSRTKAETTAARAR